MFILKSIHNDKFLKSRCIFSILLTVLFVLSVTSVFAAPWSNTVTIIDASHSYLSYTGFESAEELNGQDGVKSESEDDTVLIRRLKSISVEYNGQNLSYWTDAETYRDFILKGSVSADFDDIYDVNLDEQLKPSGNKMTIVKVDYETKVEEESIPYTTKVVYDANSSRGSKKVVTQGVNGLLKKEYKVEYRNGVEVARYLVSEEVASTPVEEVISEGTNDNVVVVNGKPVSYKRVLTCQATAYDLSFESCGKRPGHPAYGITASGTYAKVGTVAVDPRVIPLGTKMYIVSADGQYVYGYCTAEDTGGAIKGNRVDLFYNTKAECMQFGRRSVIVYIL